MTSPFAPLPPSAAWEHRGLRRGFEIAFLSSRPRGDGYRLEGCTTAVQSGSSWFVRYEIEVDATWMTRAARISGCIDGMSRRLKMATTPSGEWVVNGAVTPDLRDCRDLDLESSLLTNTLPLHRLEPSQRKQFATAAVYVSATDLTVSRLDQTYERLEGSGLEHRYAYVAPQFQFRAELRFDRSGLILDYPELGRRAA